MKDPEPASVGVVIPSFTGADFLGAIDSALAQTAPPTKIVVIDDESEDGEATSVLFGKLQIP